METEPQQQWVAHDNEFADFTRRLNSEPGFAGVVVLYDLILKSELPDGQKLDRHLEFESYIKDNGFMHLKDAIWDYLEGRR